MLSQRIVIIRDVASTESRKYKYKYKYLSRKYKYKYKYLSRKYKYKYKYLSRKYKYLSRKYKYKYKYQGLKYKYKYFFQITIGSVTFRVHVQIMFVFYIQYTHNVHCTLYMYWVRPKNEHTYKNLNIMLGYSQYFLSNFVSS